MPERLSVNSDSDSFQSCSNNVRSGELEHISDPSNSYTHDHSNCDLHTVEPICLPPQITNSNLLDLPFKSKGLHFCNINSCHILPKVDELGIIMENNSSPDVPGVCETFLEPHVSDNQVTIDGCEFIRKDRSDTIAKTGGGLLLYMRDTVKCMRRPEFKISKLETIWAEIELPNAKPFLLCTLYRPPSARNVWMDLFEEELSLTQTSGLEVILMGDFNIDLNLCTNTRCLNLINLFDLTQLVTEPTRITQTSATCIFFQPGE